MEETRKQWVGRSFVLLFCNEDRFCIQNEQKIPKEGILKKNLDKMMGLLVVRSKEVKKSFLKSSFSYSWEKCQRANR